MANNQIVELTSGDYRVALSRTGAALVQLKHQGLNYCPERPSAELVSRYHGSVIAPWANRIRDGRYEYRGTSYQVAVNEKALGNSLHGLSASVDWEVTGLSKSGCRFASIVGETSGYPWRIELMADYELSEEGLSLSFTARNLSEQTAPFSWAFHPYFQLPEAAPQQWMLTLGASNYVAVDERLLPAATEAVSREFDFRAGSNCCLIGLDHCFGGFQPGETITATLSAEAGKSLEISWDQSSPWVQLHHPAATPATLVIEPQSAPPDAFNSQVDLVELQPGEQYQAKIQISIQ